MKKLKSSLTAKIVAVALLIMFALAIVFLCIAVGFAVKDGMYDPGYAPPEPGTQARYNNERVGFIIDTIYTYKNALMALLIISIVVFIALIAFLCSAAGYRQGKDGITLNILDKIPLDLYFFILIWPFIAGVWIYSDAMNTAYSLSGVVIGLIFIALACGLPALAFLLTCATRIKKGKWWRNIIVFMILRWIYGAVMWVFGRVVWIVQKIPLVWRAALTVLGAGLIDIILLAAAINAHRPGFPIFLLFLYNLALFSYVILVVIYFKQLTRAAERLASGDFDYRVDTRNMYFDFRRHGENLNNISQGMAVAVERQMRSERLKTELITNVSHDIKTPLTSIINYVDLLGKENLTGTPAEYVSVLDRQAKKLKKLTENLVEASKASTGNLAVELIETDVGELINQSIGEYAERLSDSKITPVVTLPKESAHIMADSRLIWRVADNLLGNAVKYALPGTRLYVDVRQSAGTVTVSFKNISREQLGVSADELMERFVRGDASRSSDGSGLGLNIARSLAQLQGGSLTLSIDGDLFKAEITFPAAQ